MTLVCVQSGFTHSVIHAGLASTRVGARTYIDSGQTVPKHLHGPFIDNNLLINQVNSHDILRVLRFYYWTWKTDDINFRSCFPVRWIESNHFVADYLLLLLAATKENNFERQFAAIKKNDLTPSWQRYFQSSWWGSAWLYSVLLFI